MAESSYRPAWENRPVRQPRTPWWAQQPWEIEPPRRFEMPVRPLGAAQAASMMLKDFVASGVDEDLERLRSGWQRPPTPLSSDEEEDRATGMPRSRFGRPLERPRWQGPIDTDETARAPSRRLRSERVHSGALDFRAGGRLELLSNLRRLASSGAAAPQDVPFADPLPFGGNVLALQRQPWTRSSVSREVAPLAIERETRRAMPSTSGGHMSWEAWEQRWAEELRAFASAAAEQKQLALAIWADQPMRQPPLRYPLRPRQHCRGGGHGWSPPPPPRRDFPHEVPTTDSDSDRDDEPMRRQQWQQQPRAHTRSQQQQQQQQQRTNGPPQIPSPPQPPPQERLRRFASWPEYNSAFEQFESMLPSLKEVGISVGMGMGMVCGHGASAWAWACAWCMGMGHQRGHGHVHGVWAWDISVGMCMCTGTAIYLATCIAMLIATSGAMRIAMCFAMA